MIAGPVWTGTGPEQGLAVRDGRIVALGGTALDLRATAGEIVDASGGLALPAFRDGHVHPPQGGLEESGPAVREATSVEAVAAAVRDWADRHPEAEWVGRQAPTIPRWHPAGGSTPAGWTPPCPTAPSCCRRPTTTRCGATPRRCAGPASTPPRPTRPIGWIERRDDGSPLGTLREWQACALVLDLVPSPSRAEREATLGRATQRLAAAGIVWVQDAWVDLGNGVLDAYLALAGRGELAVRAGLALRADPLRWRDQLAEFAAARLQVEAEGRGQVRIGTVKFFADGVVEGGTAALLDPYVDAATFDGHSRGMPVWDWPELAEAATAVDALGLQLHVHAIGDAAVRRGAGRGRARRGGERRPGPASGDRTHPGRAPRRPAALRCPRCRRELRAAVGPARRAHGRADGAPARRRADGVAVPDGLSAALGRPDLVRQRLAGLVLSAAGRHPGGRSAHDARRPAGRAAGCRRSG